MSIKHPSPSMEMEALYVMQMERIKELEAKLKKQTEDYRYVFAERDRAWERITKLEQALDVALEALEKSMYPQKLQLDAVAMLKELK